MSALRTVDHMPTAKRKERETGLTDRQKKRISDLLKPICDERFDGVGARMAKAVGINQPQFSNLLNPRPGGRGAGVQALIRLRDYLQMPIDDLLDLPPLQRQRQDEALLARFRDVILGDLRAHPLPPAEPMKKEPTERPAAAPPRLLPPAAKKTKDS